MTRSSGTDARTGGLAAIGYLLFAAIIGQATLATRVEAAPVDVGYRDFHFGTQIYGTPTGEKPESKLWWNDGSWWGCLWDTASGQYSIHRFDVASQSWTNTGTPIDPRTTSKADCLWDGSKLYVASHRFNLIAGPDTPANSGRVYRYSYNPALQTYSLDTGFPVTVNSSISEILVLGKDSTGKLWITWVEGGKVKVNCTEGDDLTWGQPFDLPVQGGNVDADDISSVAAIEGGGIGLMWSNQVDRKIYFALHLDGNSRTQWEPREEALADAVLGQVADDHINLKMSCDASGTLYAVTKTGLIAAQDPLVYVLRRTSSGTWSRHVFGRVTDNHTRPILCLDPAAGVVYVFAESDKTGRGAIYLKSASVADLQFPVGLGTQFIDSSDDPMINNPTTTKQCVSASSGILVAASDQTTRFYFHNYLRLVGPLAISFFTPESGPVGTEVEVHGAGFVNVQAVTFNGVGAGFTTESETLVRATVPAGASSGVIAVTTPEGTATSAEVFTVTGPVISFFTPESGPTGTEVEVHGAGFVNVQAVTFNGVVAGFTTESDTLVRATVPAGASSGVIAVTNPEGTATSAEVFTVTGPVIRFLTPASGPVGSVVEVHGDSLGSVLGVKFNGVGSLFAAESDTLLRARVPSTASTGVVAVTTPEGTASSPEVFTVTGAVDAPYLPVPGSVALRQNRPNPFGAEGTVISFELPATAPVQLVVYDVRGRKIRVLQDAQLPPGTHTARWDGRDGAGTALPNGLYFLRLEVPGQVRSRKLLLMR